MKLKQVVIFSAFIALLISIPVSATDYVIDSDGAHASIQFRIKHLGYSWLHGRFNSFSGTFSFDEQMPASAKVDVLIDVGSLDSNHQERDLHLRGDKFLDVDQFPQAKFVSTGVTPTGEGKALVHGELTLHGVTRPLDIAVVQVGAGQDPWGGYRRGFEGTTSFPLADFGIDTDLGPASREIELSLNIEGIRQEPLK